MSLERSEIAYLLGRNGSTKQRLASFSGARLEIDPGDDGGRIEVIGTQEERELARLCVDITLQQRNNGRVQVDTEKLEARSDLSFLDVPKDAVGFVLVRIFQNTNNI
jgi:rRNA processing protein Krr1/Pno1